MLNGRTNERIHIAESSLVGRSHSSTLLLPARHQVGRRRNSARHSRHKPAPGRRTQLITTTQVTNSCRLTNKLSTNFSAKAWPVHIIHELRFRLRIHFPYERQVVCGRKASSPEQLQRKADIMDAEFQTANKDSRGSHLPTRRASK